MGLMHGFGVPTGKFVFALGLTLGVFSQGAWGQGAAALPPAIPPRGNITDYSAVLMNQQALNVALRSTSNPERCSGLQPGQNLNNSAAQNVDQLVAGRLAAIPGLAVNAAEVTHSVITNSSGGLPAIACPGPGADGACPALPSTVGDLPACPDVSPGGRFSQAAFDNLLKPIHDAGCAASCRRTAAEAAKLQMACLGEEYQKLKESMNSIEDTIRQNLDNQRKYVEAVEAEANRQDIIDKALVGEDGEGGKFHDLKEGQDRLEAVITGFQSQIPRVTQQIERFHQDQEIFTQAIQRATVERTNRCFMNEIPPGISVGPCNRGGAPARSVREFILCRYKQSLEGSTNAGAVVRTQAQQRTELLSNFIDQKFGGGSRFAGTGEIHDPGTGLGTDGGADGHSFGTTVSNYRAELESLIVQSGTTGNAVDWMRNLERKCEEQAASQVNKELASQGSLPAQWRRRLENDATTILGGAPATPGGAPSGGVIAMINEQGEAVRLAYRALTNQELGPSFQPSSCTSIASTNNSGGTAFAQTNLNRVSGCIQGLQATVECMSRGSNCGSQSNSIQGVSVPGVGDISCRFLRECMVAIKQKAMEARSLKAALQGDGTFPDRACAGGQCYGKRKFIREASRSLVEALRTSSRAFNGHAASLKNQMASLAARLQRGLRITLPRTRPTARQPWLCPNPPSAGSNGAGAEPQICDMPQPNTGDLVASLTQPVTPEDPAETFGSADQSLDAAMTAAQAMEDQVRALRGREAGRRSECRGAEARRTIANARRDLEGAFAECQGAHARRGTLCQESNINRLQDNFEDLMQAASADASGDEEVSGYRRAQEQMRNACHTERTVGEIIDHSKSCGLDDANGQRAQDQRVCGEGGRIDRAGEIAQGAVDTEHNHVVRHRSDPDGSLRDQDCIYTGGEGACAGVGQIRDERMRSCRAICPPDKPDYSATYHASSNVPTDHCHERCANECFKFDENAGANGRCVRKSTAEMPDGGCPATPEAPANTNTTGGTGNGTGNGNGNGNGTGSGTPHAGDQVQATNGTCPVGSFGNPAAGIVCVSMGPGGLGREAAIARCNRVSETSEACFQAWQNQHPAPETPAPAAGTRTRNRRPAPAAAAPAPAAPAPAAPRR